MRTYTANNLEKIKARRQVKYSIQKDRVLANCKEYREINPEIVRARKAEYHRKNAVTIRSKVKNWKNANPEQVRAIGAAHAAKRRAAVIRATPVWADESAIKGFYETAEALNMWIGEWHEVDHIVPLRSKKVCGLHVEANLQVLTAYENNVKNNRNWPQMWD